MTNKQMNIAKICFAAGLLALSPSPIRVQPGAGDSAVILTNSDIGMKIMGPVLKQFGAGTQLLQTIRSFMEQAAGSAGHNNKERF